MKIGATFIVALGTVFGASAHAFAPRPPVTLASTSLLSRSKTALWETSGGAVADDPPLGTDILVVDTTEADVAIARNWGFILCSGIFSVGAGAWALALPYFATDVAVVSTVYTLLFAGMVNVLGTFYVEKGYKLQSFLLGAAQVALGMLMESNLFNSKVTLTLAVASTVFAEGLYKVILAVQNSNLKARLGVALSGLVSIAGSAFVVKYLPLTLETTPGVALGIGLVGGGIVRIFTSLAGRDLANGD